MPRSSFLVPPEYIYLPRVDLLVFAGDDVEGFLLPAAFFLTFVPPEAAATAEALFAT